MKYFLLAICLVFTGCQTIPYTKMTGDQWEIKYVLRADWIQANEINEALKLKANAIKNTFNKQFNSKVLITIYPDLKAYNNARVIIGAKPLDMINSGCSSGNNILVCSGGEINIAVHEYTHIVIFSIPTKPVYNSWIDESICDYIADMKWTDIKYLKQYYNLPRSNFLVSFTQDVYMARLLYYIGQYLFEVYGNEKVIALLKTRSISDSLGISEETFWKSWCNWVEIQKEV